MPLDQQEKNNKKENNKKREIESRLINNNYINYWIQTQPEFGMNPFSSNPNSFLDRTIYYYIFTSIQERIKTWRGGIHTKFWLGLNPIINIIIIY